MNALTRYNRFKGEGFDEIMINIRAGTIKCGKYAHLVKVDKDAKLKGKEFFKDGTKDSDSKRE